LRVFIGARAFADEDELRLQAAVAEDNFAARAMQLATGAFAKVVADLQKRFPRNSSCYFE
jgi:hypothetical protein